MKDGIIPILIVIAIAAATVMFANKARTATDDIDKMENALRGAKTFIKSTSNITFQNIPNKNELHFWARYVLAPNYLAFKKHSFDTVLTICNVGECDSIKGTLKTGGRNILWQNNDDQYCYFLTTTH